MAILIACIVEILSLLFVVQCIQLSHRQSLPPATYGQSAGKLVEIAWGVNQTHIEVQLAYPTLGWLAMGLSPNGGMDQSDVLFAYVDDRTREVVVQDRWITANLAQGQVNLALDKQQDWIMVSGMKNATHTVIRATRKLKTCDSQDRAFGSAAVPVLYSYNFKTPASKTGPVSQHNVRGTVSINFIPSQADDTKNKPDPRDIKKRIEFRVDNVQVVKGKKNQYYCTISQIPALDKKYHAYGYEPLLNQRNLPHLHHMDAYSCDDSFTEDQVDGRTFPCGPEDGTIIMSVCNNLLGGWQSGTGATYYPSNAGLPFTPDMAGKWVVVQMHYDNSDDSEFSDDSGIRFLLSDKLRQYDAGSLTVGAMDIDLSFAIPPEQPVFKMQAQCPSECTKRYFPKDGIKIFGSTLHMHTRGSGAVLRHFRGTREFQPIDVNPSFDYNRQGGREVSPPRVVLPGDRLVLQCNYTTIKDTTPIFGGEGSDEEMCMVFLDYFPKSDLYDCGASFPLINLLRSGLQMDRNTLQQLGKALPAATMQRLLNGQLNDRDPEEIKARLKGPLTTYIEDQYWTPAKVKVWEDFYFNRESYDGLCIGANGMDTVEDDPPLIRPYVVPAVKAEC
ncbi:MOXD1 homolog 1-like [Paramacrobiotus metropolitanus]|uniref:MOXD1 homolog 1-like n=1 Tax=Paramacrobiotus metropolitanus TaxID=2943436 RepID=UPI00244570E4|nr:MOXD1 homolog 1-like [Paramacrobiotus metropolitanus]